RTTRTLWTREKIHFSKNERLQVFDFTEAELAILMVLEFFLTLCVSVVNIPSQETWKRLNLKPDTVHGNGLLRMSSGLKRSE
ncbi:MAG: hypothetical protein ACREOR_11600, partial [Candidatus Binatia bacterium]